MIHQINGTIPTGEYLVLFRDLLIALALGFLIGLERGWAKREMGPGMRIAGIRTFGLISLLGGLSLLLGREAGVGVIPLTLAGLGVLMATAFFLESERTGEYGITTEVAVFIAFVLGAMAMTPYAKLAAAAAVITTIILGIKPVLHAWLRTLAPEEMYAAFKLLLISVVMLPILPDRTYDPWHAINPREIWWMVVLISAISFAGYFAVRLAGPKRGILFTGLFGGLVSSTAVTLSLSRLARDNGTGHRLLAAGVVVASSTMFPRILVVAGIFNPSLARLLLEPMLMMAVLGYGAVWWLVRRSFPLGAEPYLALENPFEFLTALRFGLLLALILWLTQVLREHLGATGIYLTAAVSGITDVDAITLSLARLVQEPGLLGSAAGGILLAALVNTAVKGALAGGIGGRSMGICVGGVFTLQAVVGAAVFLLQR